MNDRFSGQNPKKAISGAEEGFAPFSSPVRRVGKRRTARRRVLQGEAAKDACDYLTLLCGMLTAFFLLTAAGIRIMIVSGYSMEYTLRDGEITVVLPLLSEPEAGDIVVCQSGVYGFDTTLVKRVIATEGQTVTVDEDAWAVYVDGVRLKEPYVKYETSAMLGWDYGNSYTVPEGCVFVMGDNRNRSADSRYAFIGAIDTRLISGRVVSGLFPFRFYENPFEE